MGCLERGCQIGQEPLKGPAKRSAPRHQNIVVAGQRIKRKSQRRGSPQPSAGAVAINRLPDFFARGEPQPKVARLHPRLGRRAYLKGHTGRDPPDAAGGAQEVGAFLEAVHHDWGRFTRHSHGGANGHRIVPAIIPALIYPARHPSRT